MTARMMSRALCAVIATVLCSAALVATTTGTASAAGVPCQRTYSSGTINRSIPDNGIAFDQINVPDDGLAVTDVDVRVDIDHPYVSDLYVDLRSFDRAAQQRGLINLFPRLGGGGDNLTGTVFDDSAPLSISQGVPPFTGSFRPPTPLAAMNGIGSVIWTLNVSDVQSGDSGVLRDWSVTFRYASCDLDADGIEDHVDQCLGVTARTPSGCPLTARSVTASYRHGKFKGWISSPVGGCKSTRPVTVWKVRPGPDRKLGSTTTRSDGTYRLAKPKRPGRYYATSPRVAVPDLAECPEVRSARFRIR